MRKKKLRGHKRIWKDIEIWRNNNLKLDIEYLKTRQRDHVKIWVSPYCDYTMLNSEFPQPKGETRKKILKGLIDIYTEWKKQLDELGQPYYLKIWLNDPYFSESQVVCAIGDFLTFYDSTFFTPDKDYATKVEAQKKNLPEGLNWECRWDESHFNDQELGEPSDYYSEEDYTQAKTDFAGKLRKNPRTQIVTNKEGVTTTYYSIKVGHVWLGSQ